MSKYKNIKVALISPSNNNLFDPLASEPLGLMVLEGILLELGVKVELIDASFTDIIPDADIYAFSCKTIQYNWCINYAQKLKNKYTVVGGAHVTALPEPALQYFNAVILGPGEEAIVKVLDDFLGSKKGGVFAESVQNINKYPIAPRTILKNIKYKVFPKAESSASVFTSRGCPYSCAFCSSQVVWGRNTCYYSLDRVIQEIKYLQNTFNINHFKFVDDIFTLDKKRFQLFAQEFKKLNIKWLCEARINTLNSQILEQMKESGCEYIDLGIESVDNTVLKGINKQQTIEQSKEAVKLVKSKGLKVKTYLIYGLPFEPNNIVEKTIQFIEEVQPDLVTVFTFVPYPGTDIWNNPTKYNITDINKDFDKYTHIIGGNESELNTLPIVEYSNRSRELMREERNKLKSFTLKWNNKELLC